MIEYYLTKLLGLIVFKKFVKYIGLIIETKVVKRVK